MTKSPRRRRQVLPRFSSVAFEVLVFLSSLVLQMVEICQRFGFKRLGETKVHTSSGNPSSRLAKSSSLSLNCSLSMNRPDFGSLSSACAGRATWVIASAANTGMANFKVIAESPRWLPERYASGS